MAITKLRKAVNKEHKCNTYGATIVIGSSYYDTNDKLTKKPFPTAKLCVTCGEKK